MKYYGQLKGNARAKLILALTSNTKVTYIRIQEAKWR